jgi:cytochrome c oxidase assembly protein subunit 15
VRERLTAPLTPEQYRRVAYAALAGLTVIVFTGAAVRLTGSGLGCPDWPKCYGGTIAPLETHAIIEYGNRVFSGLVGLAAIAAGVLAWRRRPFRWHLALFGGLLPLGVVAQAVLGGLTVKHDLAPGFVMSHYLLSMAILDAAFALAWCATYERGDRRTSTDRLGVWAVRALIPLGQITIFAGTAATASGPHAGGAGTGVTNIHRFTFKGSDTLTWVVNRHGALAVLLGLAVIGVWLLLGRRGGDRRARSALVTIGLLIGVQGVVGIAQYQLELPAELVWVHVVLAALTWLAVLRAVGTAGRLEPARAAATGPASGRSAFATD